MIREAENKDLEKINTLFKDVLTLEITKDVYNKILVYEQEKILGFISYSIIYERCELNFIAVLKEERNKKIASQMLEYMINDVKDLDNITLEVNVNNKYAIELYKKYGFMIATVRDKYYNNDDAYLMIRKK